MASGSATDQQSASGQSTAHKMDASVIDKIESLRRLARHPGTSYNEVEAALMALQRVAAAVFAKHGVRIEEFKHTERKAETENCVHLEVVIMSSRVAWKCSLVSVIAKNFRCSAYIQKGRFANGRPRFSAVVLGLKADAELCQQIVDLALEAGERLCHEYITRGLKNDHDRRGRSASEGHAMRRSWLFGYVSGLSAKYDSQTSDLTSGTALMLIMPPEVMLEIRRLGIRHDTSRHVAPATDHAAYDHGYKTGKFGATDSFRVSREGVA